MSRPIRPSYPSKQQGFALAVVLVLLLILSVIVIALLQNQRIDLMETATVVKSDRDTQASHNQHQKCVNQVVSALQPVSLSAPSITEAWWIANGNTVSLTEGDTRWNADQCIVEVFPNAPNGFNDWSPVLRITTKYKGVGAVRFEETQLLYPSCNNKSCVDARVTVSLKDSSSDQVVNSAKPRVLSGGSAQVGYRSY